MKDAKDIEWLSLRVANGLQTPYVGFALLDFQIGRVTIPAQEVVIAQDDCVGAETAILGMNGITACWDELFKQGGCNCPFLSSQQDPMARDAWLQVFVDC